MGDNTLEGEELVTWSNGRKIYPEVAEYLRVFRDAQREYEAAVAEAEYLHSKAYREATWAEQDAGRETDWPGSRTVDALDRARRDARDAASAQRAEALERVKQELLNSPHLEVKFIAEKALFNNQNGEVEGYARNILAILPASAEEIWREAKDNRGMCDVFDRYYDDAEAAGVFSNGQKIPGHRERAALRSYLRRNVGGNYVASITDKVDSIVKAVQEHHEAEMAKAKAEWQRQDEAYRSNGARKAAETRRRNTQAQAEKVSLVHPDRADIAVQDVVFA